MPNDLTPSLRGILEAGVRQQWLPPGSIGPVWGDTEPYTLAVDVGGEACVVTWDALLTEARAAWTALLCAAWQTYRAQAAAPLEAR